MTIYLDMDGVVADFDAGISALSGVDYTKYGGIWYKIPDEHWKLVTKKRNFWIDLPLMPNARNVYDAMFRMAQASNAKLEFLTSGGGVHAAEIQKPLWVKKHFGEHNVIVTKHRNFKLQYAHEDTYLVDDHPETIVNFTKCGGNGIYYIDPIRASQKG